MNWYVVPGSALVSLNGDAVTGYFTTFDNKIVLAGESTYDGGTVRHEMLHALRRGSGHSRADFLDRCAGVVHCNGTCVIDAGPLPPIDPAIARVSSATLQVDVRIVPDHPTVAVDGGVFTLIVTVKNPNTYPVLVDLAPGTLQSFFYRLRSPTGELADGVPIYDASVTRFRAEETKQQLFDFVIGQSLRGSTILPGLYSASGGYDGRAATKDGILIGQ